MQFISETLWPLLLLLNNSKSEVIKMRNSSKKLAEPNIYCKVGFPIFVLVFPYMPLIYYKHGHGHYKHWLDVKSRFEAEVSKFQVYIIVAKIIFKFYIVVAKIIFKFYIIVAEIRISIRTELGFINLHRPAMILLCDDRLWLIFSFHFNRQDHSSPNIQ